MPDLALRTANLTGDEHVNTESIEDTSPEVPLLTITPDIYITRLCKGENVIGAGAYLNNLPQCR